MFPSGVVIHVNEKGWMDTKAMMVWLQKVWAHRTGASSQSRSLLVWDSFRGHLVDRVKERTQNGYNKDIAVIPGGLTSVLKPLDVSINRPFKCYVRDQWTMWMSSGQAETKKSGNFKRPDLQTVALWTKIAWEKIDAPLIVYSFKKMWD